jgi:hypothetical protein
MNIIEIEEQIRNIFIVLQQNNIIPIDVLKFMLESSLDKLYQLENIS